MDRPPLEVADLVRAAGDTFIERSRKWITWKHVKVLLAISMNAPAVDIAPSPITHAEIGIARSVRQELASVGWKSAAGNFFRRPTSMWSSRFLVIWLRWSCRTRSSSTISCFAPVRKLFWKLRVIPSISVQGLASSASCIPGVKN